MPTLFRFLAYLPLPIVHGLGALLGLLAALFARSLARDMRDNLRRAGLYSPRLLLASGRELGKSVLESALIWQRPLEEVLTWVRQVEGWEHVDAARREGRGILALSPHLGCFELVGLHIAVRMPMTTLYRPPKQAWLDGLMRRGRERAQARLATPDLRGVRALLAALKKGEVAGILPDQVASKGDGVWTRFFGHPAYMPSLAHRLVRSTGAVPLLFHCERLSWGRGFRLQVHPVPELPDDPAAAVAVINQQVEALVRACPAQYLWSYRIYRRDRGMPPPPQGMETC